MINDSLPQSRYQRQMALPEISSIGQARLGNSSVLCIGAGGLGAPALQYLAAAGIGRIGIVDDDCVDLTNLQRQVIYTESDAGKPKSECAKHYLSMLNSEIRIDCYQTRFDSGMAINLFAEFDVIIDCTDHFPSKFLINDAAVKFRKPCVSASVLGFDGQISTYCPPYGPCMRCLFSDAPSDHAPNCAEAGVIGALAGMVGSMQALEAIKLCLGIAYCQDRNIETLIGKILLINARDFSVRRIAADKNAACPVCSIDPNKIMLPKPIDSRDAIYIDLREQQEWDSGHLPDAVHMPLSKIRISPDWDLALDKQKNFILYCQSGCRSQQAIAIFRQRGFANIAELPGGYAAAIQNNRM